MSIAILKKKYNELCSPHEALATLKFIDKIKSIKYDFILSGSNRPELIGNNFELDLLLPFRYFRYYIGYYYLEELIHNDINIGEADRARLEETTKQIPNLDRMIINEKRLRKANEGRARNKNTIDEQFKNLINE